VDGDGTVGLHFGLYILGISASCFCSGEAQRIIPYQFGEKSTTFVVFTCSREAHADWPANDCDKATPLRRAKSQGMATSANHALAAAEPGLAKSIAATPGIDSGENDRQ
jgi:hypothetical protein